MKRLLIPDLRNFGMMSVCSDLVLNLLYILDLGWDKWIIYPESFTLVQCSVCVPQKNQRLFDCTDDDPSTPDPPSQVSSTEKACNV